MPGDVEGSNRLKHYASLSYVMTMLLIGIPIWWKTTEVYRASLPYSDIANISPAPIAEQKVSVVLVSSQVDQDQQLATQLQASLRSSLQFNLSFSVRALHSHEASDILSRASINEVDEIFGSRMLSSFPGAVALLKVDPDLIPSDTDIVIGNYRTVYFSSQARIDKLVRVVEEVVLGQKELRELLSREETTYKSILNMRKQATGKMDIYLSLLVPEPDIILPSWDIETVARDVLQPFLRRFPLQFQLKSEILYLTSLNIPSSMDGKGPLEVSAQELGVAVNSVETLLSSQSSNNPAIHLLAYIPPVHRRPVLIRGSPSNSFLLPRWGGVVVYNPTVSFDENTTYPVHHQVDLELVMTTWIGQLRSLLGVREATGEDFRRLPSLTGLGDWEADFQLRYRCLENILNVRNTLGSLSNLLSQISNIVISDEIAKMVESSLANVEEASKQLKAGNLEEASKRSQLAMELAETAFFDPSLLALLYFPDDQKYAIYIPYFLPVGIPIVNSLLPTLKWLRGGVDKAKAE